MLVFARKLLYKAYIGFKIVRRTAKSLIERWILKLLPEQMRILYVLNVLKKISEKPARADYHDGWRGDEDYYTEISLDRQTRKTLLEIIKAGQEGKLYFSDHLRTDREILRGVWSLIGYSLWSLQTYPEYDPAGRDGNIRYHQKIIDKYRRVLSEGGLIALMDAQLTLWEKTTKPHSELQEEILGWFLPRWVRLVNQLNINNPKLRLQSKKLNDVLTRARK